MIDAQIRQIARFLCGVSRKHKALALLFAYFDESGTHEDRTTVTTIGGFVGSEEHWAKVEKVWLKILADNNVRNAKGELVFHYTDFENRTEGTVWEHMEREVRMPILGKLAAVLAASDLTPVVSAYRGSWSEVRPAHPLWKPERYPNAYSWCFETCMELLVQCSAELYDSEPIAVMMAKQGAYDPRTLEYFNLFKLNKEWGTLVDPIAFGTPTTVPALQTADMIAYEIFSIFQTEFEAKFTPTLIPLLWWAREPERQESSEKYMIIHTAKSVIKCAEAGPIGVLERDLTSPRPGVAAVWLDQSPDPDPWTASPGGLAWWQFSE